MKMRRLISALIVFTLVMASVVSVSAAAVSNVYTTYDVGTGNATVHASVTGAVKDDMISYIIFGEADGTGTPTETNIKYIDQATVGEDGTVTFNNVELPKAALLSRQIKLGTSGAGLTESIPNVSLNTTNSTKFMLINSAVIDATNKTITIPMTINNALIADNNVGINVTVTAGTESLELKNLAIMGTNENDGGCAIQLVFDSADTNYSEYEKFFNNAANTVDVTPYYMDGTTVKAFDELSGYYIIK